MPDYKNGEIVYCTDSLGKVWKGKITKSFTLPDDIWIAISKNLLAARKWKERQDKALLLAAKRIEFIKWC